MVRHPKINNNATVPQTKQNVNTHDGKKGASAAAGNQDNSPLPLHFQQFADFMQQRGLMLVPSGSEPAKSKQGKNKNIQQDINYIDAHSAVTVYKNAVQPVVNMRNSSSSEDEMQLNSSEEIDNKGDQFNPLINEFDQFPFVVGGGDQEPPATPRGQFRGGNTNAGTSGEQHPAVQVMPTTPQYSRGEMMVRDVERAKARIYEVEGKEKGGDNNNRELNLSCPTSPDEDYLMVGNHIDESLRKKIISGDYVDFAKLMPRDRILIEEDQHMEMVNKGGLSYWVPLADRENTSVNSSYRWEQAFRVFANIYSDAYPGKSGELIQYNHVIHTASQTFSWENVYRYDREFRIHMSKHHLTRSWAVILQQAWSMCLKDKVNNAGGNGSKNGNGGNNFSHVRRKICFDFNSGHCGYGHRCKFDHRCSFCNKFGHGAYNCRRAMGKKQQQNHNNNSFNSDASAHFNGDKQQDRGKIVVKQMEHRK